jgi:GT2 family glycosyltransferase
VAFRSSNGHISAASNSALELAGGEFIALLDHDDELTRHALYMVAEELNRYPDADLIYSDEDKIDTVGRRFDPHFKTDWNQDLFYCYNLIGHLGVYRTEIVRKIGGFRIGFEGSQDYDLALRFIEQTNPERIRHIPHVLYHWMAHDLSTAFSIDAKSYAVEASRTALISHFERKGLAVEVAPAFNYSYHRVIYPIPLSPPLVSLIIPIKNSYTLLKSCVGGILNRTEYPNIELIIMDNESDDSKILGYFEELGIDPKIRAFRFNGPFNYSAINNEAVRNSRGQIVGFLNNDLDVISPGWLREMVSHALRPDVGAVGCKLIYKDGRVQHAGVILGVGGVAGHAHKYFNRESKGYFSRLQLIQNYSAVTGACMLMRRAVFDEVGGFDEKNLKIAYNDVDLCLRVREAGYLIVWTPYAELYHLESASRGYQDTPEEQSRLLNEANYMKSRWGRTLLNDPYYNPNLTLDREDFSPAFPSRAFKPWTRVDASCRCSQARI